MKTYNFAIIGCGGIAKIHADAIKGIKNGKLVAVVDNFYQSAVEFATSHNCKAYKTVDELLKDESIDIVNICTPSGLHAELFVKIANAKKNVICEKPMAITEEQIEQISSAVERNHIKAEVVTQLRFTPAVVQLKNAIDSGKLGKILHADYIMKYNRTQEYYDKGGWRGTWKMDGGGALMNQGIHGIDLLQYLVGGVSSVLADCRTMARNIETEDTANILVEYNCGAIGVIQCTTCCEPGYPRRITISGTKGTVILKEDAIENWDIEDDKVEKTESTIDALKNPLDIPSKYHKLQFEDLINAIENNTDTLVDINEGRKPVDIILSSYKSSKEGKRIKL